MKKIMIIFMIALLLSGCATDDGSSNGKQPVDQVDCNEGQYKDNGECVDDIIVESGIEFKLLGSNKIEVKQDRSFVDPGFVAKDNDANEDLFAKVTISDPVDTSKIGKSLISYTLMHDNEELTLTREVNVMPALTKEMAYNFFSNVDLTVMEFFPSSFKENIDVDAILQDSICTMNEDDKYEYLSETYDYCLSKLDTNLPMSDSYVDIYSSIKQFELIEKYTNTILHSMDSVSKVVVFDSISVPTPYGTIGMSISDEVLDDSVTFEGSFSYSEVVDVELGITAQLTYDYDTETYHVRYGYDIQVGYSFFGVTIYNMYAEAEIDSDYNLLSMDVYTNIPTVNTRATTLKILDNKTIEMLSYFSAVGVYESKSYIWADSEMGYSYKINDALTLAPKTYFDVFTDNTMVYSYEVKSDHEESKYYLQGLDGWKEAYYLIDVFGPNNKHDSIIVLEDDTTLIITEEAFDNDDSVGHILNKENSHLYYYDNDTDDIEEFTYENEIFYILQDSDKGANEVFDVPLGLTTKVDLDIEEVFNAIATNLDDYEVFGILMFSIAGFDFEVPLNPGE